MSRINFSRKNLGFLAIFLAISILLGGIFFTKFNIEQKQTTEKPHTPEADRPLKGAPTPTATPAAEKEQEQEQEQAVLPEGTDIKITLREKDGEKDEDKETDEDGRDSKDDRQLVILKRLGSIKIKRVPIRIPAGWEFASGASVRDGEVVGKGRLSFVFLGKHRSVSVTLVNDRNVAGHKAHWLVHFGNPTAPFATLDAFLAGSRGKGHTLIMERKFLFDIRLPVRLDLTIFAASSP